MSTTQSTNQPDPDLVDRLGAFLRDYYDDRDGDTQTPIHALAQNYPTEQRSLNIDWTDIYQFDPDLADDVLAYPDQMIPYFEEALRLYDLPIDISLEEAHVRIHNLPDSETYYPGEFSPSKHLGSYRALRGEITKASDVYPKIEEAAFECQLCGNISRVPQSSGDFQEPHECRGCERQGPFQVNFDKSEFIDAQKLRVKVPPELADGAGQKIDAFVEDDIAGAVTIGDRVVVSGTIHFEQETSGSSKTDKFDPYLEGDHIAIEQTDQQDLDVSAEERRRIEDLANGAEGDPLEVAGDSLSTKVYGYDKIKQAIIVSLVSGGRIEFPDGDSDRSTLHVLVIGDPGTAKSKLVQRAQKLGWRTVGVTSRRATGPGLTVAAEQDDFGDGEWSLKAGAFVKANGGAVCIDELDDMKPDTRASMLEPMSNQRINVSIAGESATFATEAAVIAAGNPSDGRFDPYESIPHQFDFRSDLLSRFDLIFTVRDVPDTEEDASIADHILDSRDGAKRLEMGEDLDEEKAEMVEPPVDAEIMRKWIAVAKQRPNPPFASDAVKETLKQNFLELRSLFEEEDDSPIPITFRKLEGIVRVSEAVAKFELADEITERHSRIAMEIVGQSMQDIGKDEDGNLDADVVETGSSKSQKSRKRDLIDAITDLEDDFDRGVPRELVVDFLTEDCNREYNASTLHNDMDTLLENGEAVEPKTDHIRFIGRA